MSSSDAAFVGSVPENYDRYLASVLFDPYAEDLAVRLPVCDGMRVLEVACGTGLVSRRLVERLAGRGTLVATDLNEAMIAYGRARMPAGAPVEWRPADGTRLPFPDRAFDAVVCQFGLMFFPDQAAGVREAHRVLRPGGRYLFRCGTRIELQPDRPAHPRRSPSCSRSICRRSTRRRFRPRPRLGSARCSARPVSRERDIEIATVDKTGYSASATDAAIGLIDGNPIALDIQRRRAGATTTPAPPSPPASRSGLETDRCGSRSAPAVCAARRSAP
jgi:SAM-dependent methyltransferase